MNFHCTSNLFSFGKIILNLARSSRPEVFCKKGVLRNFAKFAGKHLCPRLGHRCLPVNFAKFLGAPFFTEHLRWLLLPCFASLNITHLE